MEPVSAEELEQCPFCEGREGRTPPESYADAPPSRARDTPGWRVRVVPNLYPAFERQEVVVHAPRHVRSLAELGDEELHAVAGAWQARAGAARQAGFPYVHALVNEGREAGASLAHSHSQLVWLRQEPPAVEAEHHDGACALCRLLDAERSAGARVVETRDGLVALCPYAGRLPYELLVAPLEHEPDGFASARLGPALELLGNVLRRLWRVEGPRPCNAWLHTGGHWHLELVPRIGVLAGIELGAGIYLNTLAPEEAAERLRGAREP